MAASFRAFAFLQPSLRSIVKPTTFRKKVSVVECHIHLHTKSSTQLFFYNLPPDDNNNNRNALSDLLPSILSIGALALFFFSPLGGLFFALTNTLFAFAILSPFILYVGFQIWQYFYTIEGACPTCGSSVRVLKDVEQPTICFNCGSQVIANSKLDGVLLYDDVDNIMDRQRNLWDTLFTQTDDEFSSSSAYRSTTPTGDVKEKLKRTKREQTIIDVDITEEK